MRVTKNPKLKRRAEVDLLKHLATVNGNHLCRLIYVILSDSRYGWHKAKGKQFLDKLIENATYIESEGDQEVRTYRLSKMLEDVPYIDYRRAGSILSCQEGFEKGEGKSLYIDRYCRKLLIENILLMLLTLHYDFGFHEKRILRVMTDWSKCGKADCMEWCEKRLGVNIKNSPEGDLYDKLEAITPKKQRTTLQEQRTAKAGLEALRKYQQEVRNEKP